MSANIRFEDYQGQVAKLATWLHRRYGGCLELDDIKQEIGLCFCRCRDQYDQSRGAGFFTLLVKAATNHMDRLARNGIKRRFYESCSLDETCGENGSTFLDLLPDPGEGVEASLIATENAISFKSSLTPVSRAILEILSDPPPLIRREYAAVHERANRARSMGIDRSVPSDITLSFIMQVLRLNWRQRNKIRQELLAAMTTEAT